MERVENRRDLQRFMPSRGLYLPCKREAGSCADSQMQLVAVEAVRLLKGLREGSRPALRLQWTWNSRGVMTPRLEPFEPAR